MATKHSLLVCCLLLSVGHQLATAQSAPARAPAPSVESPASAPGTLGSYCSSLQGLESLVAAGSDVEGLNVTVPQSITNSPSQSASLANTAWEYIYSWPLPILAKTYASVTGNGTKVNVYNQRATALANVSSGATAPAGGVTPNHDTLYAQAVLDLSQGPQIFTIPQFPAGRYWVVPFLDAYTNLFGALGSHFNSPPGDYLVVDRDVANGTTFPGFAANRTFYAPTDIVWVISRVQSFNDSDVATAYDLGLGLKISPYNKLNAPAPAPSPSGALSAAANNKVGIISRAFNNSGYKPYVGPLQYVAALADDPSNWFRAASEFVRADPPGWHYGTDYSHFGTDYISRAQSAEIVPGALPATEVVYLTTYIDSDGEQLDASGGNTYTVDFDLPIPAGAFWSLAIYNETNSFFIANPINRWVINNQGLKNYTLGANNSTLSVHIASTANPPPAGPQLTNWLPAPSNAPFFLILRLYLPAAIVLDGTWEPPAVVLSAPAASS
ncbi:hypothetical protein WJX73_004944 [Symbiochloris irregularis]|uniref:DUF1254 domain-containing protein n=1 Tax=Symbiochloris irregularis TaxID=706552 RepID=A0AAW1NVN7_9CHLO